MLRSEFKHWIRIAKTDICTSNSLYHIAGKLLTPNQRHEIKTLSTVQKMDQCQNKWDKISNDNDNIVSEDKKCVDVLLNQFTNTRLPNAKFQILIMTLRPCWQNFPIIRDLLLIFIRFFIS